MTGMNKLGTSETEPLRRNGYPAAAVSAFVALFSTLAAAPEITLQLVFGALAAAGGAFGTIAFAIERVHDKVWAPATVANILSHEQPEWAENEAP